MNVEIFIFTPANTKFSKKAKAEGAIIIPCNLTGLNSFLGLFILFFYTIRYQPKVLQAHQLMDSLILRIISIFSLHSIHLFRVHTHLDGYVSGKKKQILQFIDRMTCNLVDRYIPISNKTAYELKNYLPIVQHDKIYVLYNGIPGIAIEAPPLKYPLNFAVVGDIQLRKGQHLTVEALSHVFPNSKLHLIGRKQDNVLDEFLRDNPKLNENVIFHGFCDINKRNEILESVDIVMLNSFAEGLPTSLLESFSSGRIPIFTTAGATVEVLNDGINGFLIKENTVEETVKVLSYIKEFISLDELRSISERSRNSFYKHFTEENMNRYFRKIAKVND